MGKNVFTHIIALFFAAAFLVPTAVKLHTLSHLSTDDAISCELCDIQAHAYELNLIGNDASYTEKEQFIVPGSFVVVTEYNSPQEKIVSPATVYNKPPPNS